MVNFSKLAAQAKKAVDAAGGTDAVKDKAADLKKVAQGKGSLSDKAKQAAEVVRDDGKEPTATAAAEPAPVPSRTAPEASDEDRRRKRRHRGGGGGNRA